MEFTGPIDEQNQLETALWALTQAHNALDNAKEDMTNQNRADLDRAQLCIDGAIRLIWDLQDRDAANAR